MYLLDTNICIHLLNQSAPGIRAQFMAHGPDKIALCSVVKAELLFGARHSQRVEENLQRLRNFFEPLKSFPFDDRCAGEYGQIRESLVSQGKVIGPNDMMIAAIARAQDAVLITHNTNEFGRIAGLRMEDWLK